MTQRNLLDDFDLHPYDAHEEHLSTAEIKVENVDLEDLPSDVRHDIQQSRAEIDQGDYITVAQLKAKFRRSRD